MDEQETAAAVFREEQLLLRDGRVKLDAERAALAEEQLLLRDGRVKLDAERAALRRTRRRSVRRVWRCRRRRRRTTRPRPR